MIFKYFLQSHTLEELSVFTQYLVSLRVFNPEGAGPDTIVVVMTDEGGENHRNMRSDQIIQTLLFFSPIAREGKYWFYSFPWWRHV